MGKGGILTRNRKHVAEKWWYFLAMRYNSDRFCIKSLETGKNSIMYCDFRMEFSNLYGFLAQTCSI